MPLANIAATYTQQAAIQQFGRMADLRPAATTDAIFGQVESGQVEFGVVPIENSKLVNPVTLPPGRARLAIRPDAAEQISVK